MGVSKDPIWRAMVRVMYLRGKSDGRDGFWCLQTCAAEKLDSLSFLYSDRVPDKSRVAEGVICTTDTEGMSGVGEAVTELCRETDMAVFEVNARIHAFEPRQPNLEPGDGKKPF